MLKKNLALLLVLVMVVAAFAGCTGGTEPATTPEDTTETTTEEPAAEAVEQKLVYNLGADPKTIDPGLNAATDGGHVINNTFEGLMREDADGMLEYAMAESHTMSEDGLVYTFTIRDDVKWSDGQPVTANDFEYAWARVLDPMTASEYSWIFSEANVESFQALDEKTFEVTLAAPTPYFLGLTGFYTFFPVRQDMVEAGPEGAWAIDPELAVSNGPFYVSDYVIGEKIVLSPNEHYWKADEVKLETIELLMIVDNTTALTAYEAGEIDLNGASVPPAEIPRLIAEDPTYYIEPADGTYYYNFNLQVEPMDDVRVRKALSLAIDRTAIVETVTKGGQIPAHGIVTPVNIDANGDTFNEVSGNYGIAADSSKVAEAQQLLADAGYPNGEGFPSLEVMYNTSEGHKAIAEAIQEMWKQNLGIEVTLTNQEWAVFQDTKKQGNFQIARAGWLGDYSDPMTYLGMFVTGSPMNPGKWENAEYDALLEAAKLAEGQERFEMLYEAEALLMEDHVVMPIYYYTNAFQISDNVKNWDRTSRGVWYLGTAYME